MISRQREYQLRQKEKGLCTKCNKPSVNKSYCEYHKKKHQAYLIKYYKKPEPKSKQRAYDRKYKAKRSYGELWEHQVLILNINDEVRKKENG